MKIDDFFIVFIESNNILVIDLKIRDLFMDILDIDLKIRDLLITS